MEKNVNKQTKTRLLQWSAGACLVCLLLAAWAFFQENRRAGNEPPKPSQKPATSEASIHNQTSPPAASQARATHLSAAVQQEAPPVADADMIVYLQNEFGNTIFHAHTQIKAIEKIMAYLKNKYPDDWESRIHDFLKAVFPEMADALFDRFNNLMTYNEWLRANRDRMMGLSGKERNAALWDMRVQLFGDDAYIIWENVVKNEMITDTLHSINESRDTTLDEKLDMYLTAIRNAYEDKADRFISRRQTELMNKFLSVDAVQENLHALPKEERQEKLVTLRKAMGLDDDAIQRWNELDAERDRSWDKGSAYMSEREKLLSTFKGEEQAQKLSELQAKMFSPEELEIIRSEEAAGFFRFGHKRIYGKE